MYLSEEECHAIRLADDLESLGIRKIVQLSDNCIALIPTKALLDASVNNVRLYDHLFAKFAGIKNNRVEVTSSQKHPGAIFVSGLPLPLLHQALTIIHAEASAALPLGIQ